MANDSRLRRGVFYGWWIVLACWAITLYGGGAFFFGFGAFFKPIIAEFGWLRSVTAGAFSLSQAEGFFEGPIVGPLVDRFGPRKLMLIGITMVSMGYIALSFVNGILAFYLVYVALLAIGYNTGFYVAAQAAVGNWFIKRRALAIALLTTAYGVGGGIMVPLIGWLIAQHGWRTTSVILGIGMAILGLPLAFIVRHRPEQYGYLPDGAPADPQGAEVSSPEQAVRDETMAVEPAAAEAIPLEADFTIWEALRTPAFWILSIAFGLRTLAVSGVVVHQIPLLTDRGISEQTAAGILGLMGFMSVPGRLFFGFLGDYFTKRYLISITYVLQATGLVILITSRSIEQVYLFTIVFGLGWGAPGLLLAIRGDYFGRRHFATIAGVQQSVVAIGTIIGPVFAGWIFDTTQSYNIAFAVFIAAVFAGAVLCIFARPPKPPRRRTMAPIP